MSLCPPRLTVVTETRPRFRRVPWCPVARWRAEAALAAGGRGCPAEPVVGNSWIDLGAIVPSPREGEETSEAEPEVYCFKGVPCAGRPREWGEWGGRLAVASGAVPSPRGFFMEGEAPCGAPRTWVASDACLVGARVVNIGLNEGRGLSAGWRPLGQVYWERWGLGIAPRGPWRPRLPCRRSPGGGLASVLGPG